LRQRTGSNCGSFWITVAWKPRLWGRPIPANDLWIAASCLEHGAVLFSFDAHFEQVDGLRVIRQWADALP
jgi:tRNA(fMet)-specific endonuclease VapC